MSLHKSAILVKLTINMWDTFKKDKRVSDRVDVEYATAGGVGNYNKRLISRANVKPISTAINAIREAHSDRTTPWCYDGVSLLPSKMYFDYTSVMRELVGQFDSAVNNFVAQYPIYKANEAKVLGHLFRPSDYPDREELRNRYSVSFKFFPVPQADHFIVDLENSQADQLKRELQQELVETSRVAVQSLYNRVEEIVGHVYERLSDPANKFKNSTFENVVQLTETLPLLNVFNDEKLALIADQLRKRIACVDPNDVRKDMNAREEVANSAYDIVALLKGEPPKSDTIEVPSYATHASFANQPAAQVPTTAAY